MTQEKLDLAAERIFTLHRAYTVKLMQTKDMRNEHDLICSWVFDKDPQIPVFKTFFKVKNKAMFYLHISTPASRTIESASSSPTMTTSL